MIHYRLKHKISKCFLVPPSPVSSVEVNNSTDTTLSIIWAVSGSIDRFEIMYNYTVNGCSETGGPEAVNITNGTMRSHTLTSLNEDSSYTITVVAINALGSTMADINASTLTSGESVGR